MYSVKHVKTVWVTRSGKQAPTHVYSHDDISDIRYIIMYTILYITDVIYDALFYNNIIV